MQQRPAQPQLHFHLYNTKDRTPVSTPVNLHCRRCGNMACFPVPSPPQNPHLTRTAPQPAGPLFPPLHPPSQCLPFSTSRPNFYRLGPLVLVSLPSNDRFPTAAILPAAGADVSRPLFRRCGQGEPGTGRRPAEKKPPVRARTEVLRFKSLRDTPHRYTVKTPRNIIVSATQLQAWLAPSSAISVHGVCISACKGSAPTLSALLVPILFPCLPNPGTATAASL